MPEAVRTEPRQFTTFSEIANFLWSVADLLRGDYKQADYGKVILPMTVLRRLDCVLSDTKSKVLAMHEAVKGSKVQNLDPILNRITGVRERNLIAEQRSLSGPTKSGLLCRCERRCMASLCMLVFGLLAEVQAIAQSRQTAMTELVDILEQHAQDPYSSEHRPLSEGLGYPPQSPDATNRELALQFITYGVNLRNLMHQVLVYWTPERLDKAALRRAADVPEPPLLSRELLIFSQLYKQWYDGLVIWSRFAAVYASGLGGTLKLHHPPGEFQQAKMLRDQISELLLSMERRAASLEARATDYRLRYEFEKLRAVIARQDLPGEIERLISRALASDPALQDFRHIVEEFAPRFKQLEDDLRVTRLDVMFLGDQVTAQLGEKLRGNPRARAAISAIISGIEGNAAYEGLKGVFEHISGLIGT